MARPCDNERRPAPRGWYVCLAVELLGGCRDDEPALDCAFANDEVGLDQRIPTPAAVDAIPSEIVGAMEQTVTGELEWRGDEGSEWVSVSPGSGTTAFSSDAGRQGPVVWRRVPDVVGDELLRCPPALVFDVSITFRTEDGVLDEVWDGVAAYDLLSLSGPSVDVDAVDEGLPETLSVMPNPSPPQPAFNARYNLRLLYGTGDGPTRMEGEIFYLADFEEQQDGEVIDDGGIFLSLATWSGTGP